MPSYSTTVAWLNLMTFATTLLHADHADKISELKIELAMLGKLRMHIKFMYCYRNAHCVMSAPFKLSV